MLYDAARAGQPPEGYELVSAEDAAAGVDGARVHRPDPGYAALELPHAVVLGPKGHVGTSPRRVVGELSFGGRRIGDRRILRESALAASGDVVELDGLTVTLAQDSFANYCHWLIQGFSRLELLARTTGFDGVDRILVSPRPPAFVREALASFGIDGIPIVEAADAPRVYRCERVIAAGLPRSPGDAPRSVLDDVRARYGAPPSADSPRRVYLGRGQTQRRRVVNEDEVLDLLRARGFEAVTMDGRTVREQARILAAAECIVGAHGAALTNLVFAPPATTVVELVSKNFAPATFAELSATMGFRYVAIEGREPGLPQWLPRRRLIDADIVVDLDALIGALDAVGIR